MNKALKIVAAALLIILGSAGQALAEKLEIVPNQKVCMVTNMVFPRDQIPVQHSGKTYYGCCENCKQTLSQDAASRSAIDPVSKKPVDKSKAVIAAREDGTVIYFENKKNFEKYRSSGDKK